ncbi:MAG: DUF4097 domain-containing protein [Gemmatimonadetes bacterium]|nr:DUF4097 domain-containing protein [Gemmatimonadota bacterium]
MISTLALATIVAAAAAQDRRQCEHQADRMATLAASAGDRLDLIARSGSLRVEGRSGLAEVRVRARACASSAELLDQLTLETGRSGSVVRVEAAEVDNNWRRFERSYASLDMIVEIPEGMAATIHDGSGDTEIIGVGALDLTDGSGGVSLRNIRGAVQVHDGSGEVTIDDVSGNVDIVDGSGELRITRVTGSVTIRDGSGQIHVTGVGGDFTVSADGSGDIQYSDVRGSVTIPEKHRKRARRVR